MFIKIPTLFLLYILPSVVETALSLPLHHSSCYLDADINIRSKDKPVLIARSSITLADPASKKRKLSIDDRLATEQESSRRQTPGYSPQAKQAEHGGRATTESAPAAPAIQSTTERATSISNLLNPGSTPKWKPKELPQEVATVPMDEPSTGISINPSAFAPSDASGAKVTYLPYGATHLQCSLCRTVLIKSHYQYRTSQETHEVTHIPAHLRGSTDGSRNTKGITKWTLNSAGTHQICGTCQAELKEPTTSSKRLEHEDTHTPKYMWPDNEICSLCRQFIYMAPYKFHRDKYPARQRETHEKSNGCQDGRKILELSWSSGTGTNVHN